MEKEIELADLWKVVRQRRRLIFFAAFFIVMITGILSYFVIPPRYEATATLLVQTTPSENANAFNDVMANQKLVKTYGEIIKSRQIADEVRRELRLGMTTDELLEEVEVSAPEESLVTTITVTDRTHPQAVAIANGFASTFQDQISTIMKVDNVTILDQAKDENNPAPVQPKPLLYTGAAGVVGLLLGVALAFLRDYLDKTVKTEEQIEELLGLPVLGVIADMDRIKTSGKVKNAGGAVVHEIKRSAG